MKVQSIIDTDLYKLSMQNAVLKIYPNTQVKYRFVNRSGFEFPYKFAERLREEINDMEDLYLTQEEKEGLRQKCPYLDEGYLNFLEGYRFDPSEVKIHQEKGQLQLSVEGFWHRTILWEVPLMATISELYYEMTGQELNTSENELNKKDDEKIDKLTGSGAKFVDFGTRRRFSYDNHCRVLDMLDPDDPTSTFVGTSNPHLGIKYDTKIIGTYAHEWVSGVSAIEGYLHGNRHSMEKWVDVYQGDLGIALTDTFGTDSFFKDFNKKYAKLFDGVRHDSGDPFEFADKVIGHYKSLGIDPTTKTIVFSDSLKPEKVEKIQEHCKGRINTSYGIGTNLTNDVGFDPFNFVIKLVEVNGNSAVKLSDEEGKHTGNPNMIEYLKWFFDYG